MPFFYRLLVLEGKVTQVVLDELVHHLGFLRLVLGLLGGFESEQNILETKLVD
jgi:hypothetical protein